MSMSQRLFAIRNKKTGKFLATSDSREAWTKAGSIRTYSRLAHANGAVTQARTNMSGTEIVEFSLTEVKRHQKS